MPKSAVLLLPAARNVPPFVKEFCERVESEIADGGSIHQYLDRRGQEIATELKGRYEALLSNVGNREFYIDWGRNEEFSMEGLGPGQCGAGVVDVIEAALADAAAMLEKARATANACEVQKALLDAARALLVVLGSDPKNPDQAFLDFYSEVYWHWHHLIRICESQRGV
jgi:sulfite reductase (ferredoxin)